MSNLIENNPQAALCGVGNFVGNCKPTSVVDNGDGTVDFTVYTEGNTSDTMFKVECKARCSDKRDAGSVLKVMAENATTKGLDYFRLRTSGPVEIEIEETKVGKEKPLSVVQAVNMISPAHPNEAIEPNQNNVLFMGRLALNKFGGVDLQFGHQDSAIEPGLSPATLAITSTTAEKIKHAANKDVLISGHLTRYTNTEGSEGYSPSDQLKLSADSATEIRLTAGRIRYKANKNVQAVNVSGYEDGWDTEDSKADPAVMKEMMSKMDF